MWVKALFQSRERCPLPVPSPWGLVPLALPLHKKPAGNTNACLPALLQGEREFGWGPSFPIVAFRRLSIIAYIIFSSLQIINSLRSVDILPSSSLSLSLSSPHTHFSLTLSGGVVCQVAPTAQHCVCLPTNFPAPLAEIIRRRVSSSMPAPLTHDGDSGPSRSPLGTLGHLCFHKHGFQ